MSAFGARYPIFNPIKEEPEDSLPVYKNQEATVIGRLVAANLTVNLASGEIYADDILAESVSEFSSGSIAMETDDMEDANAEIIYGATVTEKEVRYKAGDNPPPGGLAYIKVLKRRGNVVYKGYYYPRVQAALGNDNAQTKGNSITLGTTATTFTVFACNSGDWRITKEFETEAEAKTWCKEKLAGAED